MESIQQVLDFMVQYSDDGGLAPSCHRAPDSNDGEPVCSSCDRPVDTKGWWRSRALWIDVCQPCFALKSHVDALLTKLVVSSDLAALIQEYWHPEGWTRDCTFGEQYDEEASAHHPTCATATRPIYNWCDLRHICDDMDESIVCPKHVQNCFEDGENEVTKDCMYLSSLRRVEGPFPQQQNLWQFASWAKDAAVRVSPLGSEKPTPFWRASPVRGSLVLPASLRDDPKRLDMARRLATMWPYIWSWVDWVMPQRIGRGYFDLCGSIESIRAWLLFDQFGSDSTLSHYAFVCCDTAHQFFGQILLCCNYRNPGRMCVMHIQLHIDTYLRVRKQLWKEVRSQLGEPEW